MTHNKQSKQKNNPQPTLVYLCGKRESGIWSALLDNLCGSCFIRTNTISGKDFKDCCYAITNSSVFIFVMDNNSIYDSNCLSLFGTAIAFNIPVIGVREAGYALPYEFPKVYTSTEIVDRSKSFEYKIKSKHLPSVTTLADALKVLFSQCVIFHESIKRQCAQEIAEMLKGLTIKRVSPKKFNQTDDNKPTTSDTKQGPEIKAWPQLNGDSKNNNNKKTNGHARKTSGNIRVMPELKEPSVTAVGTAKVIQRHLQNTKSMQVSKCKIRVDSPLDKINYTNGGEHAVTIKYTKTAGEVSTPELERKVRSNTVVEKKARGTIRRMSSLPCINTNYMVTNGEKKNAQAKIYRFPLSPKLERRKKSLSANSCAADDDDDRFQLSRTCSPIDFRSDEELLAMGEHIPIKMK